MVLLIMLLLVVLVMLLLIIVSKFILLPIGCPVLNIMFLIVMFLPVMVLLVSLFLFVVLLITRNSVANCDLLLVYAVGKRNELVDLLKVLVLTFHIINKISLGSTGRACV